MIQSAPECSSDRLLTQNNYQLKGLLSPKRVNLNTVFQNLEKSNLHTRIDYDPETNFQWISINKSLVTPPSKPPSFSMTNSSLMFSPPMSRRPTSSCFASGPCARRVKTSITSVVSMGSIGAMSPRSVTFCSPRQKPSSLAHIMGPQTTIMDQEIRGVTSYGNVRSHNVIQSPKGANRTVQAINFFTIKSLSPKMKTVKLPVDQKRLMTASYIGSRPKSPSVSKKESGDVKKKNLRSSERRVQTAVDEHKRGSARYKLNDLLDINPRNFDF